MDPFTIQQIIAAAQQQPDAIARMLAMQGVEPPQMAAPIEATGTAPGGLPPAAAPMVQPVAPPVPVPMVPPGMPAVGMDPAGGQNNPAAQLNQLFGVAGKLPMASADQKPIMSGGVSNAQKAPEMGKVAGAAGAASPELIMKMLLGGGQNPLRVPQLGALMRG